MTCHEPACPPRPAGRRAIRALLLVWMLAVMLAGWVLYDGPGVSSLIKRVEPLQAAQEALREWFGRPAPKAGGV